MKKKQILKMKNSLLLLSFFAVPGFVIAQSDSIKPELSVNVGYHNENNSFQYLLVETKIKVNDKWQPVKGEKLDVYLDSNSTDNLIGKIITNPKGQAKATIPVNLKPIWNASTTHKFIAVTSDGTVGEAEISKAKILIDTSNTEGAKTVNVRVMKWENSNWSPAKDVEVKIGVERSGGELKIGDDESYTTDSLGQIAAEFKRDSLPTYETSNLVLVAKIEDDNNYGSLSVEKTVPWGKYYNPINNFGQRSLWAARGKAPVWLYLMAYSIIAAVWCTLLYLIYLFTRIRKIGLRT
jgi:hypothetical protein